MVRIDTTVSLGGSLLSKLQRKGELGPFTLIVNATESVDVIRRAVRGCGRCARLVSLGNALAWIDDFHCGGIPNRELCQACCVIGAFMVMSDIMFFQL